MVQFTQDRSLRSLRRDACAVGRAVAHAAAAPAAGINGTQGKDAASVAGEALGPRGLRRIPWAGSPYKQFRPVPRPPCDEWPVNGALPRDVDVVVLTWTVAEWEALHYVFLHHDDLPGSVKLSDALSDDSWRKAWRPYRRGYHEVVQDLRLHIRTAGRGAPSLNDMCWGQFCVATVGEKRVLLFKSGMHLNQDGETLPVERMIRQIIDETRPELVLTTGTAGGVREGDHLGDVVVSNRARFRLSQEFASAAFNNTTFPRKEPTWGPPAEDDPVIQAANAMLQKAVEFPAEPATLHFPSGDGLLDPTEHQPLIKVTPDPILTTDFFEWGTTDYKLAEQGCAVEMGDAVVAMVCDERAVPFGALRNLSDPVINDALPERLQFAWAYLTYNRLGRVTSYNSAIATWAVIVAHARGHTQGEGHAGNRNLPYVRRAGSLVGSSSEGERGPGR